MACVCAHSAAHTAQVGVEAVGGVPWTYSRSVLGFTHAQASTRAGSGYAVEKSWSRRACHTDT